MYGESININSPELRSVTSNLNYYIEEHNGGTKQIIQKQGQAIVSMNLAKQAYVQGIDDDFFIAAVITLLGGIPVLFLHSKKKLKEIKNKI